MKLNKFLNLLKYLRALCQPAFKLEYLQALTSTNAQMELKVRIKNAITFLLRSKARLEMLLLLLLAAHALCKKKKLP